MEYRLRSPDRGHEHRHAAGCFGPCPAHNGAGDMA